MLVLHGAVENHDGADAVLANALGQIADGVHSIPLRVHPLGGFLENCRKQPFLAPARERANDDELASSATSHQRRERSPDFWQGRRPIGREIASRFLRRTASVVATVLIGTCGRLSSNDCLPRHVRVSFTRELRKRPHQAEQSFSGLTGCGRWRSRTSQAMSNRKVQRHLLLGAQTVGDHGLLELLGAAEHIGPAGVKSCTQLVEQLVHRRI